MAKTDTIKVPSEVMERPRDERAINMPPLLNRFFPRYGQPSFMEAARWRQFVRNQPIAVALRDTLIMNTLDLGWEITAKNAEDASLKRVKQAIDYYMEMFEGLNGDFDIYIELILQDMLDLPFGACVEVGRYDDDPEGPVLWAKHIDAGTLWPTHHPEFPVFQQIPQLPGVQVTFPEHAIERVMMSPRPEFMYQGWGMAPPQKAYIAMDMLYKADQYYWKLLIDTPEAGILDLGKMTEEAAQTWITGMKEQFTGIDGFKVPVLYEHEGSAAWIPMNRPPNDMMYAETTAHYAKVLAACYGMRLSDIGVDEPGGGGTLAGVIRGERQSKRSGRGLVQSKTTNHLNRLLPDELVFHWKDNDEEDAVARGRAMVAIVQGLSGAVTGGILDQAEARAELIQSGIMQTKLDPNKVPEQANATAGAFGAIPTMGNQPFPPGQAQPGQPGVPGNMMNPQQFPVPAEQGGRGTSGVPTVTKSAPVVTKAVLVDPQATTETLLAQMNAIVQPGLMNLPEQAHEPQMRRLIRAATKQMFESVKMTIRSMSDEQINLLWLPEIQQATFDLDSEIESPLVRRDIDEAKQALEAHLEADRWWTMATIIDKMLVLEFFTRAFEVGLEEQAISIVRALYEEGMASSAMLAPGIEFNLTNKATLSLLERSAADLVTNVDSGTKYYLKRMIVAGVRQGLASPDIAAAIRDGASAERILEQETYIDDVSKIIREGLIEMSEYRANSIVNTEIARAENTGRLSQLKKSGFTLKVWKHYGDRGTTPKGNQHPCPICTGNENMGVVSIDFAYPTVFKSGGVDGQGGEQTPPGHPGVCHCSVDFDRSELFELVSDGKYQPWVGK